MDMRGHNGTFGADPHIMCLTRVFVQRFPKGEEITPLSPLSRPSTDNTDGLQNNLQTWCVSISGIK